MQNILGYAAALMGEECDDIEDNEELRKRFQEIEIRYCSISSVNSSSKQLTGNSRKTG